MSWPLQRQRPPGYLNTYGKVAVKTHEKNDCLTEVMIASAEKWLEDRSINLSAPLADIPVSLNYTVDVVRGRVTTKLLKDARVVPYVKTNIYVMLLSSGSSKDVWDRSINHYNKKVSAGGSTRGEGALLALGGRIATGSDVADEAGSKYIHVGPGGHPVGLLSNGSNLGLSNVFLQSIIWMKPWTYDYSVHPLPWGSEIDRKFYKKPDLELESSGQIASYQVSALPLGQVHPGNSPWADLLYDCEKHAREDGSSGAKIDFILALPNALPAVPHNGIHDAVRSCGYTFFLNLVGALEYRHVTYVNCEVTNAKCLQIDYSADVMPVTHVDREKDQLPSTFDISRLNEIARGAYKLNNADNIHGLPVGVQVVGRRLEENMVLAAMKRAEDALGDGRF
ncbi:hypothetical protein M431DRAFT_552032 [Trichoderma harzianum CBS 226.95]|uniref:Amidase domain-containing protein n=1 Tax=Trichoderma harzianum CBS 226.95 TaxID=983964 RepID=A0A2T4AE84_TRIHA|nr:hypothetical protein M431DRAFT_552032 [Trichoderma harzianum CBS 226.95]PTB55400.1 hypothetical protein M431DRAFT_552032 [Trichoderma harzianum CBS 226.95]